MAIRIFVESESCFILCVFHLFWLHFKHFCGLLRLAFQVTLGDFSGVCGEFWGSFTLKQVLYILSMITSPCSVLCSLDHLNQSFKRRLQEILHSFHSKTGLNIHRNSS